MINVNDSKYEGLTQPEEIEVLKRFMSKEIKALNESLELSDEFSDPEKNVDSSHLSSIDNSYSNVVQANPGNNWIDNSYSNVQANPGNNWIDNSYSNVQANPGNNWIDKSHSNVQVNPGNDQIDKSRLDISGPKVVKPVTDADRLGDEDRESRLVTNTQVDTITDDNEISISSNLDSISDNRKPELGKETVDVEESVDNKGTSLSSLIDRIESPSISTIGKDIDHIEDNRTITLSDLVDRISNEEVADILGFNAVDLPNTENVGKVDSLSNEISIISRDTEIELLNTSISIPTSANSNQGPLSNKVDSISATKNISSLSGYVDSISDKRTAKLGTDVSEIQSDKTENIEINNSWVDSIVSNNTPELSNDALGLPISQDSDVSTNIGDLLSTTNSESLHVSTDFFDVNSKLSEIPESLPSDTLNPVNNLTDFIDSISDTRNIILGTEVDQLSKDGDVKLDDTIDDTVEDKKAGKVGPASSLLSTPGPQDRPSNFYTLDALVGGVWNSQESSAGLSTTKTPEADKDAIMSAGVGGVINQPSPTIEVNSKVSLSDTIIDSIGNDNIESKNLSTSDILNKNSEKLDKLSGSGSISSLSSEVVDSIGNTSPLSKELGKYIGTDNSLDIEQYQKALDEFSKLGEYGKKVISYLSALMGNGKGYYDRLSKEEVDSFLAVLGSGWIHSDYTVDSIEDEKDFNIDDYISSEIETSTPEIELDDKDRDSRINSGLSDYVSSLETENNITDPGSHMSTESVSIEDQRKAQVDKNIESSMSKTASENYFTRVDNNYYETLRSAVKPTTAVGGFIAQMLDNTIDLGQEHTSDSLILDVISGSVSLRSYVESLFAGVKSKYTTKQKLVNTSLYVLTRAQDAARRKRPKTTKVIRTAAGVGSLIVNNKEKLTFKRGLTTAGMVGSTMALGLVNSGVDYVLNPPVTDDSGKVTSEQKTESGDTFWNVQLNSSASLAENAMKTALDDSYNFKADEYSFRSNYTGSKSTVKNSSVNIRTGLGITLSELCDTNSDDDRVGSLEGFKDLLRRSPYITTAGSVSSTDQGRNVMTLDSNHVWEIKFFPYIGKLNGYCSWLPSIYDINNRNFIEHGFMTSWDKWVPVTSFELQTRKMSQRGAGMAGGEIMYPIDMEYTNELRLAFCDDSYKSWKRYFELVTEASVYMSNLHEGTDYYSSNKVGKQAKKDPLVVDETTLAVGCYKNLCFRCIIYVMTPQYSTIRKFDLLVIMNGHQEEYTGNEEGGATDLSIVFSIVGENPGDIEMVLPTPDYAVVPPIKETVSVDISDKTSILGGGKIDVKPIVFS